MDQRVDGRIYPSIDVRAHDLKMTIKVKNKNRRKKSQRKDEKKRIKMRKTRGYCSLTNK